VSTLLTVNVIALGILLVAIFDRRILTFGAKCLLVWRDMLGTRERFYRRWTKELGPEQSKVKSIGVKLLSGKRIG
jgi:hypothetical protein